MPDEALPPPELAPPSPPSRPIVPTPDHGSLFGGIALGFLANIGGCIAAALLGTVFMNGAETLSLPFFAIPFGIGLAQSLWIIPLYRSKRRSGATETAKGLIVAAAITFLLNAACWGALLTNPIHFQ
jgi:hypothetical protein